MRRSHDRASGTHSPDRGTYQVDLDAEYNPTVTSTETRTNDNDSAVLKRPDVKGETVNGTPKRLPNAIADEVEDGEEEDDSESDGHEYIDTHDSDNESEEDLDDS
ncbi:hypothetical protein C2845_PM18G01520 [Panicum miliaceum]|uniref:Uncharacterized protein n=1 Tax=Panicum miliaceum TaxID=4540 RepID=A0A3L6PK21_PANMI|nr:hypothetical protein C2845_PM18G01520 [Panicum miliaceum]